MQRLLILPLLFVLGSSVAAQRPSFRTPGPSHPHPDTGEGVSILSNRFDASVGVVVDTMAEFVETDDSSRDGFDLDLRTIELNGAVTIDPNAWAYAAVMYEDEEFDLFEAALVYDGLPGNNSLKVGRYFVDFGKQMQFHRHELRTMERPLVLKTFFGTSNYGDGLQYDNWFAAGERTAVRYSLSVFGQLMGQGPESEDPRIEPFEEDRQDLDELAVTARISSISDVTPVSQFQIGASYRIVPDFAFNFEPSGAEVDGLNNGALGLDATFAWFELGGTRQWTIGGEFLWYNGDVGATLDDSGTPGDLTDDNFTVIDDDVVGLYAFCDYGWDPENSAGLQYSWVELPQTGIPEAGELDFYYTRFIGAHHRLRFGVTWMHNDVSEEALRFAVQYSAFIGPHSSGTNW